MYVYNIMYLSYVSIYLSIYILSIHLSINMYISIIYVLYIYSKKKIRLVLVKKTRTHIVKVRLAPLSPAKQVRFTFSVKAYQK